MLLKDIIAGRTYCCLCGGETRYVKVAETSMSTVRIEVLCLNPCPAAKRHLRPGDTGYACYTFPEEVLHEVVTENTLGNFPKREV
jgi:hypothetical protein